MKIICKCKSKENNLKINYERSGDDWKNGNYLSLGGVYQTDNIELTPPPIALTQYLKDQLLVKKLFLHLDNDDIGHSACTLTERKFSKEYQIINDPPLYGKDVNEYLCIKKNNNFSR